MFIWDFVFSSVMDEIIEWCYGQVVGFFGNFFSSMGNMGVDLFALDAIQGIVLFFQYLGWALFGIGLVVAAFEVGIEHQSGRGSFKDAGLNAIKGFMAVSLFTILPVELYKLAVNLQSSLTAGMTNYGNVNALANSVLDAIGTFEVTFNHYNPITMLFVIILMTVCFGLAISANICIIRNPVAPFLILVGMLGVNVLSFVMYDELSAQSKDLVEHERAKYRMETDIRKYNTMIAQSREFASLLHDTQKHCGAVYDLLAAGDSPAAMRYIKNMHTSGAMQFMENNSSASIIDENPNWTMAGIFPDEGLSGVSTKKRKEFNRMMQKCRAGRIDLIITKSVSRFARNTLDSISWARRLKKLGVGIIFEKEGVNTLEMDDEILLTIFAGLAQAESESLSKNVAMGHRQSYKAGNVPFHYKGFLGYRKGADGKPEIVPEEAAVVRRIFHRYLAGDSVAQIIKDLEADGIPAAKGGEKWSPATIRNMIRNEKYIGDAILQKTYISDVLTKQSKKNNGELPKYYITNNHPAIIDRDVFQKVQEEIARRGCKRKVQSKTARTEQSKYSGKYALNEILVCGECGAPYRRVTWSLHGEKRIVWRCVSRLEHGRKLCKESPTLHETPLHAAIMDAISDVVDHKALRAALHAGVEAAYTMDNETIIYRMAKTRVEELKAQFDKLLESAGTAGFDEDYYDRKIQKIGDEMTAKKTIIEAYEARQSDKTRKQEIAAASELLEDAPFALTEYDDHAARQLVDTIKVLAKDRLLAPSKAVWKSSSGWKRNGAIILTT